MAYSESEYRDMFEDCGFTIPKGRRGLVSCPNHKDQHPSMHIDVSNGLFHCFSCGMGGRIDKKYLELFGHSYGKKTYYSDQELLKILEKRNKPIPMKTEKQFFEATVEKCNHPVYKKWLNYRGISMDVADKVGAFYGNSTISYIDDEDGKKKTYTVYDRVMFPIYNVDKKLCSIEMRFPLFGTEPEKFKAKVKKVLYPKHSSVNMLFEQYNLKKDERLYVLEGLMDCLAFRSLTGLKNSTSIFGAIFTENQKKLINEFPNVCYVYNNDTAGIKSLDMLKEFYTGNLKVLKPAGNFDDVGEMAIAKFKEVDSWLKTMY